MKTIRYLFRPSSSIVEVACWIALFASWPWYWALPAALVASLFCTAIAKSKLISGDTDGR